MGGIGQRARDAFRAYGHRHPLGQQFPFGQSSRVRSVGRLKYPDSVVLVFVRGGLGPFLPDEAGPADSGWWFAVLGLCTDETAGILADRNFRASQLGVMFMEMRGGGNVSIEFGDTVSSVLNASGWGLVWRVWFLDGEVFMAKRCLARKGAVRAFRENDDLDIGFVRIWIEVYGIVVDETLVDCEAEVFTNLQYRLDSIIEEMQAVRDSLGVAAFKKGLPFFAKEAS